jgi:hypothetical protein
MGSVATVSVSYDRTSPGGERMPRRPGLTRRLFSLDRFSDAFGWIQPRVRATSLACTRMKDRSR